MLNNYKFPILGALVGLVLSISFFQLGFFKTILLLIFMIIGAAAGVYIEKNGIFEKIKK